MVASAEQWSDQQGRVDERRVDHMLVEVLQRLTERQLDRWLGHSRTLQLSVVEKLAQEQDWRKFVNFVKRYGGGLFTQRFLSLGNLRGILHQGVDAWLTQLEAEEGTADASSLLHAIDGGLPRDEAVELLTIAIEAVVENYKTYRDYNTTTTQSDHGELLYTFVDFIRLRAGYDRVAWNLKPVVWAHEILVRHGRESAAEMWRRAFVDRTRDVADVQLEDLAKLGDQYGMQLPTIADRIAERFIRPLLIDRVRALIAPAMSGESNQRHRAFEVLELEIGEHAGEPQGAGLDVPDWLAALEDEVTEARSRMTHVSSSDRLARRIGQICLTCDEISQQLGDDS
ncbi:MAG: hypothetical protein AAF961_02375 [Planctomycetota bacterium]